MKKLLLTVCIFLSTNISAMNTGNLALNGLGELAGQFEAFSNKCALKFLNIANQFGITLKVAKELSTKCDTSLAISAAALCVSGYSLYKSYQNDKERKDLLKQIKNLISSNKTENEKAAVRYNELCNLHYAQAHANNARHTELLRHQEKGFRKVESVVNQNSQQIQVALTLNNAQLKEELSKLSEQEQSCFEQFRLALEQNAQQAQLALAQNSAELKEELSKLSEKEQECFAQFQLALNQNTYQAYKLRRALAEREQESTKKIKKQWQNINNKLNRFEKSLAEYNAEFAQKTNDLQDRINIYAETVRKQNQNLENSIGGVKVNQNKTVDAITTFAQNFDLYNVQALEDNNQVLSNVNLIQFNQDSDSDEWSV